MIPRVARLGTGFAGAGLYYLHDERKKQGANRGQERPTPEDYMLHDKSRNGENQLTSERVGFTATRNLPTTNPKKALRCMSWLAANAHNVRQAGAAAAAKAAGMSYADYVREKNPFRGRKGSKPVYTLSLAWHPTKNRTPTREDMLQAADEVLKVLGMEDRQALIVQHTDKLHPHIHLIVNRVSPINGKFASVGNDWLKLSWWALQHEKKTGFVLCHERVFNWQRRNGERVAKADRRTSDPKARGRYVRHKQVPRRDRDWFARHAHLSDDDIRKARSTRQDKEAKQFAVKQAGALLRLDERIARTVGRDLDRVTQERDRRQQALRQSAVDGSVPQQTKLFRAVANLLSPRRISDRWMLRRCKGMRQDLIDVIEARRDAGRDRLGQMWSALELRHAAERRRDEQRMAERSRRGRSEAIAARGKQAFNARSDSETARLFEVAGEKSVRDKYQATSGTKQTTSDDRYEERVARRVEELERDDTRRQRRKRKRPRGKTRRI